MDQFITAMLNTMFGNGLISSASSIVKMSPGSSSIGMVSTIINVSKNAAIPIASVLLCLYFIVDLSDQVTMDRFNSDQFIKMLMKLAFGQFMITNATGIALQFMNVGSSFVSAIIASSNMSIKEVQLSSDALNIAGLGLIAKIGLLVGLFFPYMITVILQIGIMMMCYTRLFEITVRAMVAPVGVCDMLHGGVSSQGFRYLKRCLAVALQGGLMLVVLVVCAKLQSTAVKTGEIAVFDLQMWVKYLAVMGATTASLAATKSIANEIVGA